MSLTQSALSAKALSATGQYTTYTPNASTQGSEADSDMETMSDAATSDSGRSIEMGGTNENTRKLREANAHYNEAFGKKATASAIAVAIAKQRRDDPLDGTKAYCSMCNINASEYLCTHCGRLVFCTKCCLNLHDNKYLSAHKFIVLDSVPEGQECLIDEIKKKRNAREEEERAQRRALQSQTILRSPNEVQVLDQSVRANTTATGAMNRSVANAQAAMSISNHGKNSAEAHANIDMASLTADKSVINVRLRELGTCLESGQQLHKELSHERNTTKETTATAVEAVRKRFDVLRNLISQKEEQFVAVVEQAGKERLDLATAATCSINIATSELDGFISHMKLQLDRLEDNKVQFNAQRQGMLDMTYKTLSAVDGWMHDHQSRLQDVRSMRLGVHVPIDGAADAIQCIQPPKYLSYRGDEEARQSMLSVQQAASVPTGSIVSPLKLRLAQSVPAEKFVDTPGVKVVVQSQAVKRDLNATMNTTNGGFSNSRMGSPMRSTSMAQVQQQQTGRKLHSVEQQELRNTPMREVILPHSNAAGQQQYQQQEAQFTVPTATTNNSLVRARNTTSPIRKAASPMRYNQPSSANVSMASVNASSIHHGMGGGGYTPTTHLPGVGSRNGTPTRRVMYGRADSNANDSGIMGASVGGGVGRPTVSSRSGSATNASAAKYNDPYAQRIVAQAIKASTSRANSPISTQRFTTSTAPVRTQSPTRPSSSFAGPTASGVRRGTSPLRTGITANNNSAMYRGSTDNPGPGAYNIPTSTFASGRKTSSPVRR